MDCPVCLEVAEAVVECQDCHQIFCEACTRNLRTCPMCRHAPFRVHINGYLRRVIANLPMGPCPHGCGAQLTRGSLDDHQRTCPYAISSCPATGCDFKGNRAAQLSHVVSCHAETLFRALPSIFQTTTQPTPPTPPSGPTPPPRNTTLLLDPIATTTNSRGRQARLGTTGGYYCGGHLDVYCQCCDGQCGPTNGCRCTSCMELTVRSRGLPRGYLVNREGATARRYRDQGKFYCGRAVMPFAFGSDGYCGPTNGNNCDACNKLDRSYQAYGV